MYRRTVVSALGSAPLLCLCSGTAWAQLPSPARPGPALPNTPPQLNTVLNPRRPFCTFSRPPRAGGLRIQSYATKPGGGRGKSQIAWSFAGALPGLGNPLALLTASFAAWRARDAAPQLGFSFLGNRGGDIAISAADLGAPDASGLQILGQTADDGSTIKFNSRAGWNNTLLQRVATHEIGHALGLLHATTENSIMYPIDQGINVLGPDDKAAIRALYGWHPQSRLQGGSEQSPALCACGNTLAMAWRGTRDDDNIWFSTTTDGMHWTPQRRIDGAASDRAGPSLAWDGRRLWMAWSGARNDDSLYWANTGNFFNGDWTGVQHLGDRGSSHAPRIAIAGGGPVMAWKGVKDDHGIYFSRFAGGGWGSQNKIGGVGTAAAPALCQDLDPNAVRMVWRGVPGDSALYTSTLSGLSWQPQQQVSWIVNGNGAAGSVSTGTPGSDDGPALASAGGKVLLVWRGVRGDQGLWFTQFATDQVGGRTINEWSTQANIPQTGSSHGPAIALFDGVLHAAWKGVEGDNGLWTTTL